MNSLCARRQDSVLQLGIVSLDPSRGGIKVCSRPLWGLISAGYQGIIGGRAAKRQFTLLTEDRALPHGPPRYHSNSLRFRRTRAPRPPAVARAMHASSFRQSQLFRNSPDVAGAMLTSRTISWQRPHVCISPARRGVKRGVVSGVKGNPPGVSAYPLGAQCGSSQEGIRV